MAGWNVDSGFKTRSLNTVGTTRISELQDFLNRSVIEQTQAVSAVADFWRVRTAGFHDPGRPLGNMLMLGPTGVGKTLLIEKLAEYAHGSKDTIVKIDCAELQLDHEVAKLIGSPPGYLGHRETEPLLSAARLKRSVSAKCAISLVLFDEIEKAHDRVWRLLLGVLDKGVLTTGANDLVNFRDSMIFMTSNLGSDEARQKFEHRMGFDVTRPAHGSYEGVMVRSAQRRFSPEFLNRLDATITFNALSESAIFQIVQKEMDVIQSRGGHDIQLSPEARVELCRIGYSKEYGARELKRILFQHITVPLANAALNGDLRWARHLVVDFRGGKFVYSGAEKRSIKSVSSVATNQLVENDVLAPAKIAPAGPPWMMR